MKFFSFLILFVFSSLSLAEEKCLADCQIELSYSVFDLSGTVKTPVFSSFNYPKDVYLNLAISSGNALAFHVKINGINVNGTISNTCGTYILYEHLSSSNIYLNKHIHLKLCADIE